MNPFPWIDESFSLKLVVTLDTFYLARCSGGPNRGRRWLAVETGSSAGALFTECRGDVVDGGLPAGNVCLR